MDRLQRRAGRRPETSQRRFRGYQAALAAAGLPFDPALLCHGDCTYVSGPAGPSIFSRWPSHQRLSSAPTTGWPSEHCWPARRRGRHLPADLAVVGFDDIPEAAVVDPPLTTVAQPLAAVAFILSRLSGQTGPEPRRVVLTPALVVRASCGAIIVPPA